jgi:hypothetical protein
MIFRAAHASSDLRLVCACIRYARRQSGNPKIVRLGVELCAARPSAEGEAFCREVLEGTGDCGMARIALSALPPELRRAYFPRVEHLLRARRGSSLDRRDLVLSLRGLLCQEVSDFLVELINDDRAHLEEEALAVLADDAPDLVARFAMRWMRLRRSHQFRLALAQAYVRQAPADGAEFLRAVFTRRQRAVHKRNLLELFAEHYPDAFPALVRDLWPREPASLLRRHALELLLRVDRDTAVEIMLAEGVRANRIGTRIAVCTILASVRREDVTAALLERLRNDPSRWVRLQALRSLAAPGRHLDNQQVTAALQAEKDAGVLALRAQILGD